MPYYPHCLRTPSQDRFAEFCEPPKKAMRAFRIVPAPPQAARRQHASHTLRQTRPCEAARRHVQGAPWPRAPAGSGETIPAPAGTRKPNSCLLPLHPQHAGFACACWTPCVGIHLLRFSDDLAAGVVVGIVALPLAMAFAMASGVNPQAGIFTAVIAGFLISRWAAPACALADPPGVYCHPVRHRREVRRGQFIAVHVLAGLMLIAMGLLRMGQIIRFFPMPLVTGFTNGIAVLIFLTQLKDFCLPVAQMPSGFLPPLQTLNQTLAQFHPATLALSAGCLALILFWPKSSTNCCPRRLWRWCWPVC